MKQKLGEVNGQRDCSSFRFVLLKEDDRKNAAPLVTVRGEDGTRPKLSWQFQDMRMYVGSARTQLKERFAMLSESAIVFAPFVSVKGGHWYQYRH